MKFAYISEIFPQHGETWVRYEIEALRARGHQVRVYALRGGADAAPTGGAEVVYLPGTPAGRRASGLAGMAPAAPLLARLTLAGGRPRRAARALRAAWQAAAALGDLRAFAPDLIVCHFAGNRALVGALLARAAGRPYLMITHARDVYRPRPEMPALADGAAEVWTISQFNVAYLRRLYPRYGWPRLCHVRVGIDLAAFPFAPAPTADGPLVFVARMVPKKGPDLLVAACALLYRRGWRGQAVMIGTGPLLPALQAHVDALGLGEHVRLLGSQPSAAVAEQLRRAAAFVLPCRRDGDDMDGIPVAIMEAMAVGALVVTTGLAGIPELVADGQSGVVVPPDDVEALAAGIERTLALGGDERLALARAARAAVARMHDVGQTADQLERVAGSGPRARAVVRHA